MTGPRAAAMRILACAMLMLASGAYAQSAAGASGYADEARDWGVAPTNRLRQQPYHGPTPLTIPGAQVVQTRELQAMLAGAVGTGAVAREAYPWRQSESAGFLLRESAMLVVV